MKNPLNASEVSLFFHQFAKGAAERLGFQLAGQLLKLIAFKQPVLIGGGIQIRSMDEAASTPETAKQLEPEEIRW